MFDFLYLQQKISTENLLKDYSRYLIILEIKFEWITSLVEKLIFILVSIVHTIEQPAHKN